MFTNKSKIMNAGDYPSYVNIPDLVRQQFDTFFCILTSAKFEQSTRPSRSLSPCFQYTKLGRITSQHHHTVWQTSRMKWVPFLLLF